MAAGVSVGGSGKHRGEGRAPPFNEMGMQLAAHGQRQAGHDGHAQACAAMGAPRAGVTLAKGFEQMRQESRRDSWAGVAHHQSQAARPGPGHHFHTAVLGKLCGVGHQVAQHLTQALRVGQHGKRQRQSQMQRELQAFGLGQALV